MYGDIVQQFQFAGANVRIIIDEHKNPLFCATDVAKVLGYKDATNAIKRHCRSDSLTNRYPIVDSLGRTQEARFIPESDLYRLIINSKLPTAQQFERWVMEDVLPALRKHGTYTGSPQDRLQEAYRNAGDQLILAGQLINQLQAEVKALETQKAIDAPKVVLAEAIVDSESTILIGELAKLLAGNGIQIGQNRLFKWLRANGYLISRKGDSYNLPTQRSMELGLFKVVKNTRPLMDGSVKITRTTKVTGKGQQYFINRFIKGDFAI